MLYRVKRNTLQGAGSSSFVRHRSHCDILLDRSTQNVGPYPKRKEHSRPFVG